MVFDDSLSLSKLRRIALLSLPLTRNKISKVEISAKENSVVH